MTRISKDPEERKSEIIDAAEELFLTKGYEQTAVNDIVNKVGVAKGLFYYYFKCKDDILNAIAEKILNFMVWGIRKIVEESQEDAITKIYKCIEETMRVLGIKNKGIQSLANHVHGDENSMVHRKIGGLVVEQLVPLMTRVVQQGIEEGHFDTSYPEEAVNMLLNWGVNEHNHIRFPIVDIQGYERKAKAIEDIVERILGAKRGSMNFVQYVQWMNVQ